jgi:hypothetical protein
MNEEALEILRMVKEGKVSPEQGAELLQALKTAPPSVAAAGGERPHFLRVRVNINDEKGEKVVVNCNLPTALADLLLKIGQSAEIKQDGKTIRLGEYLKEMGGVDISSILQMVKDGAEGKLVDVDVQGDKGEKVKVEVIVD